jgi:hypothetical protein
MTGERIRGIALEALLANVAPPRRDLARRVYVAMRRRKLPRNLAADIAAGACSAFDGGADFATIAAELRVPANWLTPRAPDDEDAPGAARARATARALRAEPAPVTPHRRIRSATR